LAGKPAPKKYELSRNEVVEQWAVKWPKVVTWLNKLQDKKPSAWYLWVFCRTVGKTPDELLALKDDPRNRDAEYLLDNFVADETLDLTNSAKVGIVTAVKSFFAHNYRDLARKSGQITWIQQRPYRRHSKEELLKIYRSTQNPRDRALITFTWSSAIAKESLSHIQWLHLERDWERQELPHIGLPSAIIKGHGRGKYKGVEQHTFLTPEAKRDLIDYKDYLERVKGLRLKPEDHIWLQLTSPFAPLDYDGFGRIAIELSERSGIKFGWHDARRHVETALEHTKMNPNWTKKIRGRKVRGEDAPYSQPAIEELRAAYREAVALLQFTEPTEMVELKRRQEVVEELATKIAAGQALSEEERAKMAAHRIRLTKRIPKHQRTETNGGEACTDGEHCGEDFRQIPEGDLLEHLKAGWQIVHKLANGEVIVKK